MYGIVLIAVLVVMGGAIAFIGDRVGSKVGKKKLSLFNLRPRHTSVIVTIATGIVITMLTFAVLAAASENVRVALFGMEKLNAEMKETHERLAAEEKKLTAAEREHQKATEELKKSRGEVESLQKTQAELETQAQALVEGNARLEEAKTVLTTQNEALSSSNEALSSSNAALSAQNGTLSEENRELEKRTEALREGLLIMREGDISFRAGEVLAAGVVHGNRPIEAVREDMASLIQLANMNCSQHLGIETEESMIWIYTPEYDQATESIASGTDDVVVRIVSAGNLVRGEPVRTSLQLFKNRTIFEENEFILARSFTFNSGEKGEAETIVMRFLQEVNMTAKEKGILPDPIRGSVGVMGSSQFYETVNAIAAMRGQGVLSAYALEETGVIGPLRLRLHVEAANASRGQE